ncbi:N-glycosylase/DNA lyase [Fasciola gigantica]|uniref:DNA-(apurinic or apyrimidinic site) lyase n=1 Tax=Fasciola gigantica TaxID=46835 RepID=A0A504Z786_FASGI|nr:N-glycosylase/DNA lyase [Fasciola gigantica]
MTSDIWFPIHVNPREFNLRATLTSGQAFRWIYNAELNEWYGVINGTLWRLRQSDNSHSVEFHMLPNSSSLPRCHDPPDLVNYFRLNVSLSTLLTQWRTNDRQFARPVKHSLVRLDRQTSGIRLLRQDPVETVFAFLTSANNNVTRIIQLLMRLSEAYGKPIHWPESPNIRHWQFPSLATLAQPGMEDKLRAMGFGYRSNYIPAAARWIQTNGGEQRLFQLRNVSTDEAREFLMKIPGIGNKVADCICLSALDKINVVPVDVHILRAAREREIPASACSSLTPKSYRDISKALTTLWGDWAGWAQAIDFSVRLGASIPKRDVQSRKRKRRSENSE